MLKVDTIVTHCKRRYLKVIRKWCRCCSRRELISTLKVDTIVTHCKRY